jgi:hypothetical protein
MAEIHENVHIAYGTIDDQKLLPGNWSVKVVVFPQPPVYADSDLPLRYGGNGLEKTEDNPDGYGRWITLGEPPWVIAQQHGDQLVGKFVEVRFIGTKPWEGQAFIVNEPDTEDTQSLMAEERGVMRVLSANTSII